MKKRSGWILIVVSLVVLTFGVNALRGDDGSPAAGTESLAPKAVVVPDAEARIQAAEQRARAAEAAAAKATADAQAAQAQAAQALEAARQATETVARLQAALARLDPSGGPVAPELAVLKKVDGSPAADSPSLRVAQTAPAARAPQQAAAAPPADGVVTTVSKVPMKIYGNILFNSNYVDRGANTVDIPLFAVKRGTSADQNHQNYNMTLRQSRFGLRYDGKIFSDANLIGVFEFDLLGGKPAFANGAHFDIFRLRLAYGRIDWTGDSLEAGQDWTVFSPLNPTTLASYAIPGFSTSGNLWNRLPQIRYEHRAKISETSKFVFTGAVLDPNAGDNPGLNAVRPLGLGERSAVPAFESRVGFTAQTHGKESSAGVSSHYSRFLGAVGNPAGTLVRSPIDSYGVCGDWNAWLTSGLRVTGEFFHGRALGIFSGNIAQSAIVVAGRALGLNATGGWMEVHAEAPTGYDGPWKKFSANVGYGTEDNRGRDFATLVGLRKRNQTYMFNGQYKFSPNFTFAIEYRLVETDWNNQRPANQKMNWGNVSFFYTF